MNARSLATAAAAVAQAEPSIVSARGLAKSHGSHAVFGDLTFDVAPGSVLGLVGRNGSGKSTLLRCLLGLLEPDAGSSSLLGDSSLALGDAAKQRIGYVPQQPDALGWMQVGPMLDFVGRFYPRWDDGFVTRMLERWDIARSRPLAALSPGERQRVALIRALAPHPDLLILDEPAASLDPVARRELLRQIVDRAALDGTTVVFSSHIVSDLERVASHVAFLHEGRLLLCASMDEIKERCVRWHLPAHVAATLGSAAMPGELVRRQQDDGGLRLVVLHGQHDPEPSPFGNDPGIQRDVLGLEDLFVEIVE